MTARDIESIKWLRKEIEDNKNRLQRVKDRIGPSIANYSAIGGRSGTSNPTADLAASIVDLEDVIKTKEAEYIRQLAEIEKAISDFPPYFRQIIKYRAMDGRSWSWIAIKMGTTADSVRMLYYRKIKKL